MGRSPRRNSSERRACASSRSRGPALFSSSAIRLSAEERRIVAPSAVVSGIEAIVRRANGETYWTMNVLKLLLAAPFLA